MKMLTILCGLFLISCSYSINMVYTKGKASDIIDELSKSSFEASYS